MTDEELQTIRDEYNAYQGSDPTGLLPHILSLLAEVERLRADYRGGDQESQACSWSAVYQECERLGLLSHWPEPFSMLGRDRVISFIRHLHGEVNRL